jgi:cell wall-associated NlpC family hydrolase
LEAIMAGEPWESFDFDPNDLPILTAKMRGCKYELGAKAKSLGDQLASIGTIDCSGFHRLMIFKLAGVAIPDGSWNQGEYYRENHFKPSTVDAGKLKDGILRAAILPQQPGPGVGRHIVFILNGRTYESYGGNGPGSRSWTGRGWQGKCKVFVLAYPAH